MYLMTPSQAHPGDIFRDITDQSQNSDFLSYVFSLKICYEFCVGE